MRKAWKKDTFFAVISDGSMDKSVTEQDVVYVPFADSETAKSAVASFELLHHPKVKMHLDLK